MKEKYNVICGKKGDIVRINGLNDTMKVKAIVFDSNGKIVQVIQSD